ncbi:MAG: DUF21 domain-containing protein [Clostridia bacterium]
MENNSVNNDDNGNGNGSENIDKINEINDVSTKKASKIINANNVESKPINSNYFESKPSSSNYFESKPNNSNNIEANKNKQEEAININNTNKQKVATKGDNINKNEKVDVDINKTEADKRKPLASDTTKGAKKLKKRDMWAIKITIITFFLAIVFSFISEITATKGNLVVAILLLVLLILTSIVFDGIGVAVTSCDVAPLNSMAAKKVPHAKIAIKLVQNAEKVNNICSDVIGDICGIISGACGVAIVTKIATLTHTTESMWVAMIISSIIGALTVGGKAFEKKIAINNSKEFVMLVSRVMAIFYKPDKKEKKKK